MFGWKRHISIRWISVEQIAGSRPDIRPFALCGYFESVGCAGCANRSLCGQQARFAQMIVVRQLPQNKGSRPGSDQRVSGIIRNCEAAMDLVRAVSNLIQYPTVLDNPTRADPGCWNDTPHILFPRYRW